VPAITVTSALRSMIPALSNAWKAGGSGSPPTSALLIERLRVFT